MMRRNLCVRQIRSYIVLNTGSGSGAERSAAAAAVGYAQLRKLKRQPLNETERLQDSMKRRSWMRTERASQFKDKNSGGLITWLV